MKKILITNNLSLINNEYSTIYTDSPYIVDSDSKAIHLDTFLDNGYYDKISNIQNKGFEIDKKIIELFFPKYGNRNIGILQIREQYTHIYKKIFILFKLLNRHKNDEVTIAITLDEVYNHSYDANAKFYQVIDRFVNVYYWIAERAQLKDIKLVCKNIKNNDLLLLDNPIESWFLRLINLDKKVLIFNLLRKLSLIKEKREKIYIFKKSNTIREIEPYLYDKGISFVLMEDMAKEYKEIDGILDEKKLNDILDIFDEKNVLENTFKLLVFDIYKKLIKFYLEKEIASKKYISKLNNSIKFILTNTISDFDSLIFAKQLQENGYQIINVMHYIGMSYTKRSDNLEINECSAPNMTLCYNNSEKNMFNKFDKTSVVYPISSTQDTKITRFKKLQRIYVNKMLKISNEVNVFYPSVYWPLNNASTEGISPPDMYTYNFEKKMIKILSTMNKRAIYKRYSRRGFIDSDLFDNYLNSFKNVKIIEGTYDFRYISSIGDIFILGAIGYRSTANWMLKYNKPIIYLHTNKYRLLNDDVKGMVNNIFFTIDIDKDDWEINLINLLNKPYNELIDMWKDKQIYRDQHDEEWLLGMKSHSGKLGAKYIKKFMTENIIN